MSCIRRRTRIQWGRRRSKFRLRLRWRRPAAEAHTSGRSDSWLSLRSTDSRHLIVASHSADVRLSPASSSRVRRSCATPVTGHATVRHSGAFCFQKEFLFPLWLCHLLYKIFYSSFSSLHSSTSLLPPLTIKLKLKTCTAQ